MSRSPFKASLAAPSPRPSCCTAAKTATRSSQGGGGARGARAPAAGRGTARAHPLGRLPRSKTSGGTGHVPLLRGRLGAPACRPERHRAEDSAGELEGHEPQQKRREGLRHQDAGGASKAETCDRKQGHSKGGPFPGRPPKGDESACSQSAIPSAHDAQIRELQPQSEPGAWLAAMPASEIVQLRRRHLCAHRVFQLLRSPASSATPPSRSP